MMILVNQEGKRFNFDNILHYQATGYGNVGEVVCKLVNNETWILGEYDSLERAEEIVKEIDNIWHNQNFYNREMNADKVICMNTLPKIYYMPEE